MALTKNLVQNLTDNLVIPLVSGAGVIPPSVTDFLFMDAIDFDFMDGTQFEFMDA